MSQRPLEVTVYPNILPNGYLGGGGTTLTDQQRRMQQEGSNPFKMFDLAFPQFNLGNGLMWALIIVLVLITTAALLRKK